MWFCPEKMPDCHLHQPGTAQAACQKRVRLLHETWFLDLNSTALPGLLSLAALSANFSGCRSVVNATIQADTSKGRRVCDTTSPGGYQRANAWNLCERNAADDIFRLSLLCACTKLSLLAANTCCNWAMPEQCTHDELGVTDSVGNVNTMPKYLGSIHTSFAMAAAETKRRRLLVCRCTS